MRFIPAVREDVARSCRRGAIGDPRMVTADFGVAMAATRTAASSTPCRVAAPSSIAVVYAISPLALMLFGEPEEVLSASAQTETGVDEQVAAILRFPAGRLALLTASLTTSSRNEALIMGSSGNVRSTPPSSAPSASPFPRPTRCHRLARVPLLGAVE